MTKTADFGKYKHFGCGTRFCASGIFILSDVNGFDKNVIIFARDMSSFPQVNNKKEILTLGKGLRVRRYYIDKNSTKIAQKYAICFTEQ